MCIIIRHSGFIVQGILALQMNKALKKPFIFLLWVCTVLLEELMFTFERLMFARRCISSCLVDNWQNKRHTHNSYSVSELRLSLRTNLQLDGKSPFPEVSCGSPVSPRVRALWELPTWLKSRGRSRDTKITLMV